jgi:hypothetical protein
MFVLMGLGMLRQRRRTDIGPLAKDPLHLLSNRILTGRMQPSTEVELVICA